MASAPSGSGVSEYTKPPRCRYSRVAVTNSASEPARCLSVCARASAAGLPRERAVSSRRLEAESGPSEGARRDDTALQRGRPPDRPGGARWFFSRMDHVAAGGLARGGERERLPE